MDFLCGPLSCLLANPCLPLTAETGGQPGDEDAMAPGPVSALISQRSFP